MTLRIFIIQDYVQEKKDHCSSSNIFFCLFLANFFDCSTYRLQMPDMRDWSVIGVIHWTPWQIAHLCYRALRMDSRYFDLFCNQLARQASSFEWFKRKTKNVHSSSRKFEIDLELAKNSHSSGQGFANTISTKSQSLQLDNVSLGIVSVCESRQSTCIRTCISSMSLCKSLILFENHVFSRLRIQTY